MTNSTCLTIEQVAQQFQFNSREHFTGELRVQADSSFQGSVAVTSHWSLYFLLGRLIWANSDGHRFRRWRRAFLQHCPHLYSESLFPASQPADPFWEYRVIASLFRKAQIQREEAIALTEYLLGEIMFDMLQSGGSYQQNPDASNRIKRLGEPILYLNPQQLLSQSRKSWQAWREAELASYSPHLAPAIANDLELRHRIPTKSYNTLTRLIDGQSTLADIAAQTKQDPLRFTRFLTPLFRKGLLALRQVPDLVSGDPQNGSGNNLTPVLSIPKVLCIDDNPTICWQLEQILTPMNYSCISIQDPLRAIPALLEQKPDLVFLDLVMPIASGYEICSQIRRISAFKEIPVIILTGNDGIVDRVRAKVVGASDFMAKPINPQRLMDVVRRYCPPPIQGLVALEEKLRLG